MRNIWALAIMLVPAAATAQGRMPGAALAERWCMGCHVVEPEPPAPPGGGAPNFSTIAARPTTTAASLSKYLSSGHTHMPDFSLSNAERNALVSYILSLRSRR